MRDVQQTEPPTVTTPWMAVDCSACSGQWMPSSLPPHLCDTHVDVLTASATTQRTVQLARSVASAPHRTPPHRCAPVAARPARSPRQRSRSARERKRRKKNVAAEWNGLANKIVTIAWFYPKKWDKDWWNISGRGGSENDDLSKTLLLTHRLSKRGIGWGKGFWCSTSVCERGMTA